jgi:hypothetical protein
MTHDDSGLDKAVINYVMRLALLRLHEKNIYVVDILHILEHEYQIRLSRAKFDDWFMTRPERKKFAPLPVFEAVVKVLFYFDANVLNIIEMKQLIDARGIPVLWLQRFASLFSHDDWQHLLQSYGLMQIGSVRQLAETHLFGRDDILHTIEHALQQQQRCIVLTGEKGIGKSSIITQSMRHMVHLPKHHTIVVDVHEVVSISDIIYAIGMMCDMHSDTSHDIRLRLSARYAQVHVCIVLENVSPVAPPIATIYTSLKSVFAQMTLFVATHHQVHMQHEQICVLPVPALTYDHNSSPGCQLFHEIVAVMSGRVYSFDQVRLVCEQAQGNPQKIILYANAMVRRSQFAEDTIDPLFESLPFIKQQILIMLVTGATWMSREFVTTVFSLEEGNSYDSVQQLIDRLLQQHMLLKSLDDTMISVHDITKELFEDVISRHQTKQMLELVNRHLTSASSTSPCVFIVEETMWMRHWRVHEYETMLSLIKTFQINGMHEQAVNVLVRWVPQLITVGLAADVLVILESYGTAYVHDVWYNLAMVMLYAERGLFDKARLYHNYIMEYTEQRGDVPTQQLITVAYAHFSLNSITTVEDAQSILIRLREHLHHSLLSDTDILGQYAYIRSHSMIAQVLFTIGQFSDALTHIDIALNQADSLNDKLMQLALQNDRSIILLYLGHSRLAQSTMMNLAETYKCEQYPLKSLQVELRLAAAHWILSQHQQLLVLLERNIDVIITYGTIKDMLYFLDLHIGVLKLHGYLTDAILLDQTMNKLRVDYRIQRGVVFDQGFAEWRERMHQELNNTTTSAQYMTADMTVYDILNTMRRWYDVVKLVT